ncbi:MAG: bifunctional histidinol-phosphatase/imidazoleglycerol-phosphate dehydratase HisB [Xanthomonadales bacterium]|nr:bifunctional histidinol-phosphatase/imidazoleglycerol-phosphate dehydratase HisB [Xanthomonadales bacterium]NIN58799.1 bifunctional histidinol-phosphatase/imidazoleglycerol-phosphate dehydratase HisB [Xanthomonadales bacterium]NIN74067.1 bifunctional histidinol-phosphatase/imidazoleglycerol-phosphate dehydratase HisB [Xanthomonadales bacterium]NIO14600.1 bifunctional histidinol-phosphatase/imidazoleglycerol-phosphate dehydratase HisB [Xanthomonadales bacterium]NIP11192.1 bifunctional histidi
MSKPNRRILFLDRDGTLIVEPPDEQVDSLEKLALVPGVIPALLRLQAAGYEFVIVSNQDGRGSDAFPEAQFLAPHQKMLDLFASQGIHFAAEHIDPHFESDNAASRKPGIGMLLDYLRAGDLDFTDSWVIGDRQTDLELAANLGVGGLLLDDRLGWPEIAHRLCTRPRRGEVVRETRETRIRVAVDLDDSGAEIGTGIGFFDHMLEQLAAHGGFRLALECRGDLEVDEHHTVEDCALALGEAISTALADRRGIGRYGFVLPMDEALAQVAVDLSGRPALVFEADFPRDEVGGLSTEMVRHFFHSLSQSLRAALHLQVTGENTHHMVEALFKGCGRALRPALARHGTELPSTKGLL